MNLLFSAMFGFLENTALITWLFYCQVYPFWPMRNVLYVEECFFEERVIQWNLLSMYEKFQQRRIWKRCSKEIWSYFVNKKSGFKVRLLSILYARGKLCFEKIFFIGMQNCNYSERESFCYGTFVMVMYWNLSI